MNANGKPARAAAAGRVGAALDYKRQREAQQSTAAANAAAAEAAARPGGAGAAAAKPAAVQSTRPTAPVSGRVQAAMLSAMKYKEAKGKGPPPPAQEG